MSVKVTVATKLTLTLCAGILFVHGLAAALRVHRETSLFERDVARDEQVLGRALSHAIDRAFRTGGEPEVLALVEHATQREDKHFIERFSKTTGGAARALHPKAAECLLSYAWPGNVRELQNCIERAVILERSSEITVESLPPKVREPSHSQPPPQLRANVDPLTLEEVERRHILEVFSAVRGNKSLAAKLLGLNRKTLYRKLREFGVLLDD